MSIDQRIAQPRERAERERAVSSDERAFDFEFHTDEYWDPIEATHGTAE
jgi:hypothetical protein